MDGGILNAATSRVDTLLHDLIAPHYLLSALVIVLLILYIVFVCWAVKAEEGFSAKGMALNPTSVMDLQKSSAGMEGMVSVGQIAPNRVGDQKNNASLVYNDPALSCRSGDVMLDSDDPFQYEQAVLRQEVALGMTEGMVTDRLKNGALGQQLALTGKL